ncbi:SMP-30/gluconolactonase/LRE family protein [Streptomyces sp. NPDC015130]|uniref:SMP-30/gluconolactonase/LRE family protein n=1 Tax=Streptomyces sp. NPDC015130 TaxID=3364940 RepID=UPI0036F62CBF
MSRVPRLAATVAAALALTVLASGPGAAVEPVVTDPRIVARFDFALGQTPENIALEPDGSANLTLAFARQVVNVDKKGGKRTVATLPAVENPNTPVIGVAAAMGIARAHDGTLYVTYATGTAENGVWRIGTDGGAPVQIAQLPPNGFPNSLALDEKCGALYVADSVLGTVWRVPAEGGAPTAWATGTALQPLPAPDGLVGANGLKVHNGAVWVSNTDRRTLLRIPVEADGGAGPIETRATGLAWIDDFAFTGHDDTVLAARIMDNALALVRPDGTHKDVLDAQDGLSNPTSVAVRGKTVYVPSASFFTEVKDPNLLLADLRKGHGAR